jgi:hypothetical protein
VINIKKMNENEIKKNILDKIESGEIKMQPKTYFVLKIVMLVVIAILILITSAFLLSFIFFSISVSGRLFLLGFGTRGLTVFFLTFPWWILFIDIVFVIALEWLLKRFQFGYRNPIIYTLGGVMLLTLAAAYGIESTSLHGRIAEVERSRPVPVVGAFYSQIVRPPHEMGVFRGVVTSVGSSTFVLENSDQDMDADNSTTTLSLTIFLNPSIGTTTWLRVGDTLLVAGDRTGSQIHIYGIQKIK